MSEPIDDRVRGAWQGQQPRFDRANIGATIERRLQVRRRENVRFVASAALIVPGWLWVLWFLPDLRWLAGVGLMVGAALAWHVVRRNAAQSTPRSGPVPCAAFQLAELRREREYHRSLSTWGMFAILVGQAGIVAALLVNPRFEKNELFTGSLTLFVVTVAVILGSIFRRTRKMLGEVEHELSVLAKEVEA